MEATLLLILMLSAALIVSVICITLCFLANLGCNTYVQYQDTNKKIEVRTKNSNPKR